MARAICLMTGIYVTENAIDLIVAIIKVQDCVLSPAAFIQQTLIMEIFDLSLNGYMFLSQSDLSLSFKVLAN